MLKCYDVKVGTIGFVSDEKKILFPTDEEFEEYMQDQEDEEDEFHARANRLAEPPAYIKGVDY